MYQKTAQPTRKSQTVNRGDDGLGFGTQFFRKDSGFEIEANNLRGNMYRGNTGTGRMLPGGRMNVRADPVNAHGAVTSVRQDNMSFPVGPADGGRMGNYATPTYAKFNGYKGNANPWISKLNVAQNQLLNNPLAKSIAAV
jgi:hypothetical protein